MKSALVWGSSGGIGSATVEKLVAENWDVLAVSRSPANFGNSVTEVEIGDIRDPDEVATVADEHQDKLTKVDLWVYAIGDITSTRIADMDPEDWNRITETNLKGSFLTSRYSLPLLKDEAHMVFVGAVSERTQLPGLGAYVSAKAGLESFVEVLGKEERDRTISIVRPEAVDTPFWDKVSFDLPHGAREPEEVADRILEAYEQKEAGEVNI
ncbi:MAG: SDR family NAD(P)-dependent oxidoreductase [Candidatus Bipolaricaulia bacterium]